MFKGLKLFLSFLISLVLFSDNHNQCIAYSISANVLLDLQETSTATFGPGWTATALTTVGVMTSGCNGKLLMGGYGILGNDANEYFEVTYTGLPVHNVLYFTMLFWEIDSWDNFENDRFQLQFDTTLLDGWVLPQQPSSKNVCGGSFGELNIKVVATVAHSALTLNLRVISKLTQLTTDESFGFREINITFATLTGATPTNQMCAIAPISMPGTVTTCTCQSNQYEYPASSGNCYACHPDCATCTSSASTSCGSCVAGKYLNGTQCVTCHSTCLTCSGIGSTSCTSCALGDYLTPNGQCISPCNSPLVASTVGSINYCNSPCASLSSFIYWDQSCSSTCPPIYQQQIIGSYKLCQYPCSASQYLYWNGSCLSGCTFPLTSSVQRSKNFCIYPCATNQFLHWNGTCLASCPSPFSSSMDVDGQRYCNIPCPSSQYYSWQGFCVSSCNLPFRIQPYICILPCDDPKDYYNVTSGTCTRSCKTPNIIDTSDVYLKCLPPEPGNTVERLFLFAPTVPDTLTLVVLVRVMNYVRYLDIEMPYRLQRLALSRGRSLLSLNYGFHMPSKWQEGFAKNSLYETYEKHSLHSRFLVNFWQELSTLAIMFLAMVIFVIIETLSIRKQWKILYGIFSSLRTITHWNLCIILLSSSIDNIVLYSYFEFTTFYNSLDSATTWISLIACLVVISLIVGLTLFVLFIILKRAPLSRGRETVPEEKCIAFSLKYKPFRVTYLGFNNERVIGRFFFLVYMVRIGTPLMLATILHNYPVLQSFLQAGITITIILLLLIIKPVRDTTTHIQLLIFEAIVLMMNVSVATITVHDLYDVEASDTITVFGDIVVLGNTTLNCLAVVFVVIKTCQGISSIYPLFKTQAFEEKVAYCVQLAVYPLQLGGMGFESIFGSYSGINLTTELGTEAGSVSARKKGMASSRATGFSQISHLTNKIQEQINQQHYQAKLDDMSELKNRLDLTPNAATPQDLTEVSNYSRTGTPFVKPNNYETDLNLSQVIYIGSKTPNVKRKGSGELPSSSVMDSSFAPMNRENPPKLGTNTMVNASISYDVGDSLFIDPSTPMRGYDVATSNHLTPISFKSNVLSKQ